jgi:hypothetical protein
MQRDQEKIAIALLFGGDCHVDQRRFIGSAALW